MSQQSLRILNAPNDMRNSLHRKFYHKNLLPLVKEHFTGTNISRLPFPRPPFLKLSVLKHFRQEFRLQLARFERTSIFFRFLSPRVAFSFWRISLRSTTTRESMKNFLWLLSTQQLVLLFPHRAKWWMKSGSCGGKFKSNIALSTFFSN